VKRGPRKSRKRPPIKPDPKLLRWWKSVKIYEGQFAKPGPPELRIP